MKKKLINYLFSKMMVTGYIILFQLVLLFLSLNYVSTLFKPISIALEIFSIIMVIYVYNRNGEYAIKDCEWKQVYGNPQNGLGKFKIINIAYGSDSRITSAGLQVASIYIRDDKESLDLTVNGNYFTIDGSDLPYVMSKYKNVAGTGIVATYNVQNVLVSMIDIVILHFSQIVF